MELSQHAEPSTEMDRRAKDRLFGEDSSDRLRKKLAMAQFMAGLDLPSEVDEDTCEPTADAVTQPAGSAYPNEPIRMGRFTVLRKLGQGGMGVVYAAYDETLDRKIALKLMRSDLAGDERGRARMLREAQALARLSHPNVVQVHEIGEWQGHDFLAMEFIEGKTLRAWLGEHERSWQEVLAVMSATGRGLAAAHEAGLVHRDFKPANILVAPDGRPRVLDFGLARSVDESGGFRVSELIQTGEHSISDSQESSLGDLTRGSSAVFDQMLTATGAVLGTPAYMAPEQHLAQRATELSDQFSFCLVLYEALYGERPFKAKSRNAYANAVICGEIAPAPAGASVPAWLREIVCRGLAPSPQSRWDSMDALLAELDRDRAQRWRRLGVAAGMIGVVASAFAFAPAQAPEQCAIDHSVVADSWGQAQREQLAARFAGTGLAAADELFAHVGDTLDAYADALVAGQRGACTARWIENVQTDAQLELRMACLEQRERELRATVEVLGEVDAQTLARSAQVLRGLGDIDMCEALEELERGVPVPKDVRTAVGIAEAREDIARARANRELGRLEEARLLSDDLRKRAQLFGYAPLVGEVALLQGENALRALALDEAEAHLLDAIHTATLTDDVRLAADGWLTLAKVHTVSSSEDPSQAVRLAEAYVERLGELPRYRFVLHTVRGHALHTSGDYEGSLAAYDLAVGLAEAGFVGSEAELVDALIARSATSVSMGDRASAWADLTRAIDMQAGLGADNPKVLDARFDLALTELDNADFDAAQTQLREVIAGFERVYGPRYPFIGHAHLALSQIEMFHALDYAAAEDELDAAARAFGSAADLDERASLLDARATLMQLRGDPDAAVAELREYLALYAHNDAAKVAQAYAHARLGVTLANADRADEALVELDAALEAFAPSSPDRLDPLLARAGLLRARGELAGAQRDLEQALALTSADSGQDFFGAEVRVSLAEVLVEQGEEPPARLLEEALNLLEKTPERSELRERALALRDR